MSVKSPKKWYLFVIYVTDDSALIIPKIIFGVDVFLPVRCGTTTLMKFNDVNPPSYLVLVAFGYLDSPPKIDCFHVINIIYGYIFTTILANIQVSMYLS